MKTLYKILIIGLVILLASSFLFSYVIYHNYYKPPTGGERIITDTISISKTDTIYKDKVLYTQNFDTIIEIKQGDSIIMYDTVQVPIDYKYYTYNITRDSIDVTGDIYYHGWHAEIDSISLVYNRTIYNNVQQKKQYGWSAVIGPQIGYSNKGLYLGVGITFGFGKIY